MRIIRRILVARDFSSCADLAVAYGTRLAERLGAEVHVVFVRVLHGEPFGPLESVAADDEIAARLVVGASSVRMHPAVVRGIAAAPALLEYARTHDIDLIVTGTHGRRGLRHVMLGSVAEELVRASECPVLSIRGSEDVKVALTGPDAPILVPVDFSTFSNSALSQARLLAARMGAAVHVLHVIEETVHPAFYQAAALSVYDLQPGLEQKALAFMKQSWEQAPGPTVPVTFEIGSGRAAPEIVRSAERRGAGMIVMNTHGLSGFAHLFLGSVAERVVRSATCPVITLRAEKRTDPPEGAESAARVRPLREATSAAC